MTKTCKGVCSLFFTADNRTKGGKNSASEIVDDIRNAFDLVKEEFDEHLLAINENTTEQLIQNNHICELDQRLGKIEERMEEIHNMLRQVIMKAELSVQMTKEEQRVFLLLYTHDKFITPKEISSKLAVPMSDVGDALDSMMDKGVPVEREMLDGRVYFRLSKEFKLRQAKENIIKIDPEVTRQYQNTLLKQFFEA